MIEPEHGMSVFQGVSLVITVALALLYRTVIEMQFSVTSARRNCA